MLIIRDLPKPKSLGTSPGDAPHFVESVLALGVDGSVFFYDSRSNQDVTKAIAGRVSWSHRPHRRIIMG